ncbi:MAG: hypothetical protein M1820_010545 [Bogoriella megaspora]|nr:MAG: hypothetical protein M1820_010545 [Bogoriella megaspora]
MERPSRPLAWGAVLAAFRQQRSRATNVRPGPVVNQVEIEETLRRLCLPSTDRKTGSLQHIGTETIQQISNALTSLDLHEQRVEQRGEHQGWRARPRTYTVLRIIQCIHLMDSFVKDGFTDIDLPYSHHTLPGFVQDESVREKFLLYQNCVLTDAREIETSDCHVSLEVSGENYFRSIATIGQGGFGVVDLVCSKLSQKSYARKRVTRGRPTERNLEAQRFLIKEIKHLRNFSHKHLVKILGSYTDKNCIAFLMQPIADHDLNTFLVGSKPSQEQCVSMRNYFGCLAGAIDYLHLHKIRHRDIKSENILIKGDRIFITDFGTAYEWSKANATTQNRNVPFSVEYTSPEVIRGKPRNTASDMWSLGVVFLEMATVLLGNTISKFKAHMDHCSARHTGGRQLLSAEPYPYANLPAVTAWMEHLQRQDHAQHYDKEPLQWIKDLLQHDPEKRRSARGIMQDMQESASSDLFCCPDCLPEFRERSFEPVTPLERDDEEYDQFDSSEIRSVIETLFKNEVEPLKLSVNRASSIENWINAAVVDLPTTYAGNILQNDLTLNYATNPAETISATGIHPTFQEHANESFKIRDTGLGFGEEDDGSSSTSSKTSKDKQGYFREEEDSSGSEDIAMPPPGLDETNGCVRGKIALDETTKRAPHGPQDLRNPFLLSKQPETSSGSGKATKTKTAKTTRSNESNPAVTLSTGPIKNGFPGPKEDGEKTVTIVPQQDHSIVPLAPSSKNSVPIRSIASKDANVDLAQSSKGGHRTATQFQDSRNRTAAEGSNAGQTVVKPRAICSVESQNLKVENRNRTASDTSGNFANARASSIPNATSKGAPPKHCDSQESNIVKKEDIPQARPPKLVKFAPIPATNSSHKSGEAEISPELNVAVKHKAHIKPGITSGVFMSTAWEEPTTVATSVMTASTRKVLNMRFLERMDKQYRYLEYFCQQGKAQAVRMLLDKGSNPGTPRHPRPGPLIYSIRGASVQHYKCFRALLDKGANTNITDKQGLSMLHLATDRPSFKNYHSLVRDLVNAGIDPNTADRNGDYPLTKIFAGNETSPLEECRLAALACILQSDFCGGTNVNISVRGSLQTPLHLAVRRRDAFAVGMLLHKGANVNVRNAAGVTPLLLAANQWRGAMSQEQGTVLELLLSHRELDINATAGSTDRSALFIAVAAGSPNAVIMLLNKGADLGDECSPQRSAMTIAKENERNMPKDVYDEIVGHLRSCAAWRKMPQRKTNPNKASAPTMTGAQNR